MMSLQQVSDAAAPYGLVLRGGFHPVEADNIPALSSSGACRTLLLLGNVGRSLWPVFEVSPERADGSPHALDRWTRRVLGELAPRLGAEALFPFGGPPWLPFQRWAMRAESVSVSPLGILIHPGYGLWHAYRAALAFAERLDLGDTGIESGTSPCDSCAGRPCLSACPVGAFRPGAYDVTGCRSHVSAPSGAACRDQGCAARLACPVGREHVYAPAQMAFHMAAFLGGP
jgi:hypothetical protein